MFKAKQMFNQKDIKRLLKDIQSIKAFKIKNTQPKINNNMNLFSNYIFLIK